jgi:hypothetical protein
MPVSGGLGGQKQEGAAQMGGSAYKPGTEIKKLVEEIHRAQAKAAPITFTFRLTIAFEELDALTKYIDKFIADRFKQKYPYKTEAERILLSAMEALAAALPEPP